jgi:hypothetical protein
VIRCFLACANDQHLARPCSFTPVPRALLFPTWLRAQSNETMDQKQFEYAVSIAASPEAAERQQANDFLRDVLANSEQHWPVSLSLCHRLEPRPDERGRGRVGCRGIGPNVVPAFFPLPRRPVPSARVRTVWTSYASPSSFKELEHPLLPNRARTVTSNARPRPGSSRSRSLTRSWETSSSPSLSPLSLRSLPAFAVSSQRR